jgi:glycosyltransferase involved in cell wall biosynthesis
LIQKLSIIIPAYNEETTIKQVLQTLIELELTQNIEKEIIVVNDFSSDQTAVLIQQFIDQNNSQTPISLINQSFNQGKGAALRIGIQKATGDYLIPQDADLELIPKDINKLLEKAIKDQLDVVYGSRFKESSHNKKGLGLWANIFLTKLSNIFTGFSLTDMESCYKLMRTSIAQSITIKENRFGFEPEITAKLSKIKGLKIDEVPIRYEIRTYDEGKKIGWKDGLHAIYCIFRYQFRN